MGSKSALETRKRLAIAGCGAVALLVFLFAGPHTGNTGTGEAVAAETESDRRLSPSGNADDLQAAAVGLGNPQEGQVEEPASVPRSNFRCFESDEFAQICTYELMCFDGDKVCERKSVCGCGGHMSGFRILVVVCCLFRCLLFVVVGLWAYFLPAVCCLTVCLHRRTGH